MSIQLDPTHGVNPSLQCCFYCGKDKALLLFGRLSTKQKQAFEEQGIDIAEDGQAPHKLVTDREPCDACKGFMKEGVILIGAKTLASGDDPQNPQRTGLFCVVRDDFLRRARDHGVLNALVVGAALKSRVVFIEDRAWDLLGLPRQNLSREEAASYVGPEETGE